MAAIPIGFIIGGPIAGKILGVHWLSFSGWRWLFLLEGIPAVIFGVATLFVLPDRPNEVRWLGAAERDWLVSKLEEERRAKTHVEYMSIWQALRHPPVLILTTGLFFTYTGGYAFWFWVPTMLQRLTGWTDVARIGWIGAIPFIGGLVGILALGSSSDRTRERRWHFAGSTIDRGRRIDRVARVPAFEPVACRAVYADGIWDCRLFAGVLGVAFGVLECFGRCGGRRIHNCTASIGGFFGPKMIGDISKRSGSFNGGFAVMIACFVIASVLVLICRRFKRQGRNWSRNAAEHLGSTALAPNPST